MSTLASLLMGLAGPMLVRALLAIGISTVTFTGVTIVLDQLIQYTQSAWGSFPAAILALASIAGVPKGLGMICGAYSTRVALWAAASATKFVVKP